MKWDAQEAYRLDRDAMALVQELVGPPNPEPLIVDRLRAQLDGDKEREEAIYARMRRRDTFWRAVYGITYTLEEERSWSPEWRDAVRSGGGNMPGESHVKTSKRDDRSLVEKGATL